MIEVTFLSKDPGVKKQLGFATFSAIPLAREKDFGCSPKELISFASAQRIADDLNDDKVTGEVEGMIWQRDKVMR